MTLGRLAALMRQRAGRSGPVTLAAPLRLWLVALAMGVAVGEAVALFRMGIAGLQTFFYGTDDIMLHSIATDLPWYVVLVLPVLGGLAVGLILTRFAPDGRAQGVADVIEGAVCRGGRVDQRAGLASVAAALITLSTGGSTGREGPAVHLGAVMAARVSQWLKADAITGRDILGCAAAAAVSASFNAPLAGVLFAMEVILRHFALHAFGPIVLSGVAATVIGRLHFGNITEFVLPAHDLAFYLELPAFALLGLVAGVVGSIMVHAVFVAEDLADRACYGLSIPPWGRPAVAGALLGAIALAFPHIIGVGYETTTRALTGEIGLATAILFAAVKVVAVALTLAGRMGGGVFSPALMLGALTGAAFGTLAIDTFPGMAGSLGLYALAGMGAVAGAVLGAPISTTLIVFELTGDWQAGIAVMIAVALASVVADRLVARSFFLTQLARKGINVASGPQGWLRRALTVGELMRPRGAEGCAPDVACWELHAQGASLSRGDTLARALPVFERLGGSYLPVMAWPESGSDAEPELLGALFHTDALAAYARLLEDELREEHS